MNDMSLSFCLMQMPAEQASAQSPGAIIAAIALVLLAAIIFAVIYWKRRRPPRPRIRILPREKVIVVAKGQDKCPVCWKVFEDGQPTVKCRLDASHVVHRWCKPLMKGICPFCQGPL